ncbi:hypothetical protein Pla175_45930 [Pirellulimonas nuda]|uniref:Secondary thiamine-phosphate synthase enzyme n=1 Tax=Pirellulimonas nuda TaxID=2528009 RepID=A0A518DI57_9BACT|nr:secondary thiamine-phosphate synthase enzyme YjbQ [Pirellulimonas nuda]QDU91173.1 hypothetical protein Pla175_45930 [Pirellulimonas nuda]
MPQIASFQSTLTLSPRRRGFHLVTDEVLAAAPWISGIETGVLHVFLQHTSASLTLNENADRDVRTDLEASFSAIAPESFPYRHTCEGPDDMPAHVKSSLLGASVSVPIQRGGLALGVWQGIYLCEHRDRASARRLVLTAWGSAATE